jgi:hypothetical protein
LLSKNYVRGGAAVRPAKLRAADADRGIGIRKERGKLPAPTTLDALRVGLPLAAGPPICAELAGPALCEPVIGAEICVSVVTEHPVNTETIKSMTIRLCQ